jgi:hypothetical protein
VDKLRAEIGRLSSDDLDDELHIIVDYGDWYGCSNWI